MSIDPYGICPCGSGKKVKFCCCSDIIADLDRVARMLEGDQRIACLERVEKLVESGKDRAAILSIKAMIEMELDRDAAARKTVATFVEKYPDNPVALAQQAMLQALDQNTTDAVESMQKALSIGAGKVAVQVREAIEMVGRSLLLDGNIVAARRHLMLVASCNGDRKENDALALLARLDRSTSIPLLLKDEPQLDQSPDDAPWKDAYDRAMSLAPVGAWREALGALEPLEAQYPENPCLLKSTAWLQGWLGNRDEMIDRLRRYALLEGIGLDNAVEAEAVAQFVDRQTDSNTVDVLNITFVVEDADALIEKLQSDDRVSLMRIDPNRFQPEDGPPPKVGFTVLDRPLPKSGVGIERDAVPTIYGELLFFGKETDCDARLEYLVTATEDLEQKKKVLQDVVGELIREEQSTDVHEEISATTEAMELKWRFPADTPADHREAILAEAQKDMVLTRFPDIPMDVLDGKTPAQASKEPAYRVRLLATLLRFELALHQRVDDFDFNQLRTQLGLPIRETVDPWTADITTLPLVRLSHVDAVKMSDDQIVQAFSRAAAFHFPQATRRLGGEIAVRPSLDQHIDKASVYHTLARESGSSGKALHYLAEGMSLAKQKGQSPASWKIDELAIRMGRGETVEVENLLADIQKRHFDEPGVSEAVMEVLRNFGVMGSPGGPPEELEPTSSAVGPGQGEAGQIWTPESASGDPKEKPSLWVPGMD